MSSFMLVLMNQERADVFAFPQNSCSLHNEAAGGMELWVQSTPTVGIMIVFWAAVLGLPTVLGLRVYCTFYISEHTHRVLGLGWVY